MVASTGKTSYRVGEQPSLRLTITNTSKAACKRDVGATMQELIVTSGGKRVWSSDDCAPSRGTDVRTLQPGARQEFGLIWSGTTSAPECEGERTRVAAGKYQVTARLEKVRSKPADFSFVR